MGFEISPKFKLAPRSVNLVSHQLVAIFMVLCNDHELVPTENYVVLLLWK